MHSITKIFEIRDRNTFIPAMAMQSPLVNEIRLNANKQERSLIFGAGYTTPESLRDLIALVHLQNGKVQTDPMLWRDRTMQVAHDHICENFATLQSGSVIDVEYILGETKEPKKAQEW